MKPKEAKLPAVMSVERGETIVGAWVTPTIPEVGVYKLLAKRKVEARANGLILCNVPTAERNEFIEAMSSQNLESRMCWLQSIGALPERSERRSRCAWLTPIFIHSTARSMRTDASSNFPDFGGCNKSEIENPQLETPTTSIHPLRR